MRKVRPYIEKIEKQSSTWKYKYKSLKGQFDQLTKELAAKQARIDALMMEFCPGEMPVEQKRNWEQHQTTPPQNLKVSADVPT
jgi:chromosome segregation ATPase